MKNRHQKIPSQKKEISYDEFKLIALLNLPILVMHTTINHNNKGIQAFSNQVPNFSRKTVKGITCFHARNKSESMNKNFQLIRVLPKPNQQTK